MTYLVCGQRPWARRVFDDTLKRLPGSWYYLDNLEALRMNLLWGPRFIFFLHWSDRVPSYVTEHHEAVGFHMTDLPYGRGGSPLQNLLLAGHRSTVLTMFRLTEEMDAGPIYDKVDLSLEGGAEEIYLRAMRRAAEMIERLVQDPWEPKPQDEPVTEPFRRRRPQDSELCPAGKSLSALYDAVRMTDATGYPRAFLSVGGYRFEFSRAALYSDRVEASVTIREER